MTWFCKINMKKIIIIVLVLLIGLGIYYFISNKMVNNIDSNIPANIEIGDTIINIENFSFSPLTVTIKKGTKITWVNNDNAPHTVTSTSDGLLNSPTLAKGESFSFVFDNVGSTKYYCNFHKSMQGIIVVE